MYSLVTTVFNEESSIKDFINSLNEQTLFPDELIILDGGSTDHTVDILNRDLSPELNFKLLVDDKCNRSFSVGPIAKGRNIAITHTKYENILVTDAGCVLDKNWVQEMIKSFEQGAEVVSGGYKAWVGNEFQEKIGKIFCPPLNNIDPQKFLPSSRSLGFKKRLWKTIGGYPETSFTAEDTLFDLKIFELKPKIIFNPNAFVYWKIPSNRKELKEKLISYGYGEGVQRLFPFKYLIKLLILAFPLPLWILMAIGKKEKMAYFFYWYETKGYIKGLLNRL